MVLIPWAKLKDFKAVPPVIAMTAYVSEQDIKSAEKPVLTTILPSRLTNLLLIEKNFIIPAFRL